MATQKLQIYRCEICGNIVEVLDTGAGELVCCDQPMTLLKENTTDAATEKHVPIIEETDTGVTVKVGTVPHPMAEEHFIEWIEILSGEKAYRQFLTPGDAPQASFDINIKDVKAAREYCNLHRLWKST